MYLLDGRFTNMLEMKNKSLFGYFVSVYLCAYSTVLRVTFLLREGTRRTHRVRRENCYKLIISIS